DPEDPVFLNAKDCVRGPKGKELSQSIFPKPESSFPGGLAVGRHHGDEAILLQAIDPLGRLDPEDAGAILIRRQHTVARKSIGGGESADLAIRYAVETVRIGNPQGAATGGYNGRDRAVG